MLKNKLLLLIIPALLLIPQSPARAWGPGYASYMEASGSSGFKSVSTGANQANQIINKKTQATPAADIGTVIADVVDKHFIQAGFSLFNAYNWQTYLSGLKNADGNPLLETARNTISRTKEDYAAKQINKEEYIKILSAEANIIVTGISKDFIPHNLKYSLDFNPGIKENRYLNCAGYAKLTQIAGEITGLDIFGITTSINGSKSSNHIIAAIKVSPKENGNEVILASNGNIVSAPMKINDYYKDTETNGYFLNLDMTTAKESMPEYADALFNNAARICRYDFLNQYNTLDSVLWTHKGFALYKGNNYEESILCFDKALQLNPMSSTAWSHKGESLLGLKRYEEALTCLSRSLELSREYGNIWNNQGVAFMKLERYGEAINSFDQALTRDPGNSTFNRNRNKAAYYYDMLYS